MIHRAFIIPIHSAITAQLVFLEFVCRPLCLGRALTSLLLQIEIFYFISQLCKNANANDNS